MQNFIPTASKKIIYSDDRTLIPVLAADTLLAAPRYKKIVNDLQKLLEFDDKEFEILCNPLINNFVQLTQLIPDNYSNKLGTLMNNGLWRALLTLQLLNADNSLDETKGKFFIEKENPLFRYLVFSAALLYEVGAVTNGISVIISQADGSIIKEWLPYQGAMHPTVVSYYRIRQNNTAALSINSGANLLLARQLLPNVGFNWLAEDRNIFSNWINLLTKHKEKEQTYLSSYFELVDQELQSTVSLKQPILPANLALTKAAGTNLADDFLAWLKNGASLPNNNERPLIHFLGNRLLLELPTLVLKFCQQSELQPKPPVVIEQLAKIGLVDLNEPLKYRYDSKLNPPISISQMVADQPDNSDSRDPLTIAEELISSNKEDSNIYDGFEVIPEYFSSFFNQLQSLYKQNSNPDELTKESKKIARRTKLRKMRRFRIILKEQEEALKLQQQLNLGKK